MKNSEIHNGFSQKEIRDFLSLQLKRIYNDECENKKEIHPYSNFDPLEWSIIEAQEQIRYNQKKIELIREKIAILKLIKNNKWQEFDVSDYVIKDKKSYMSFIGTEKEYNKLMLKLTEDK